MIIVALSDIHDDITGIETIADVLSSATVVVLAGDLTAFGGHGSARRVVHAVREHSDRVLAVSGNCDFSDVDTYLTEEEINLQARHVVIDGVAFAGAGGSLPCPAQTPNETSEEGLAHVLKQATDGVADDMPVVLVSHQPPRDTCADKVRSGVHVGSTEVRRFIEQRQPLVCLTGHIHEGRGIDEIGVTKIVNPGPLSQGGYAYAEVSDRLDVLEIRQWR